MSWIITGTQRYQPAALLDQFPGAAAAYSLRNLVGTSNPAVVRVRRDNDDAEQDFTAAQITDGTLTAFCGAGDGFVRTWYDQSGNDNHAIETVNSRQPQIVNNGVVLTENGTPSLSFDGVDDRLLSTSAGSGLFTVYCVGRARSASSNGRIFGFGQERSVGSFGSGATWGFYRNAALLITSLSGFPYSSRTLITLYLNVVGSSVLAGNSSAGVSFAATGMTPTNLGIGCNGTVEEGDVVIQELIHYNFNAFVDRSGIEANINAHYSIF